MFFMFVQLIGLIGWILLVVSYWKKDINGILLFQLVSGVFYAFHYYFLGAISGLFVIVFELVRDLLYYKTDWDHYIFIGTIPFYIFFGIINYTGFISLFPVLASIVDGYGLSFKKKSAVVGAIVSSILWIVYDFVSGSYIGIVRGVILLVSNIMVLVKDNEKVYRKVK